ncbi:D-glycero-beta-D-manno-heptose-7-phosphate kinase [Thermodesulfatator autotrophicus]|uniref:Carbohydrate kinase n=1 Tax=Thermodesulfatator autotrophicus TaxID=1795632 RepID=A0A177E4L7_9BACT|nr:D-glycero-beta-D-manno-heptose-7-phosphate kinase [Thermodesulfatator autotrophicus]OAG26738.1 carbohydrate kinase [Thermodesulfatator autotrophicus]
MPDSPLKDLRFLVVGDVMLDRYFWGDVERISPEAPVPVFNLKSVTMSLGGAANVANNLKGLGTKVELAGVVGQDNEAQEFLGLAKEKKIGTKAIIRDRGRPTTVKTRIIASSQQLLRIDAENTDTLSEESLSHLRKEIEALLPEIDALILSDYAKGILSSGELCRWLIGKAREFSLPVMVDPKGLFWRRYEGATCITPNLKELKEIAKEEGLYSSDMAKICEHLIRKYNLSFMLVTLGPEGMYLHHPEIKKRFPAQAREVYDVSGAGDTVIATLTAFYVAGYPLERVVNIANQAAGIVVGKVGTQPILWDELKSFIY